VASRRRTGRYGPTPSCADLLVFPPCQLVPAFLGGAIADGPGAAIGLVAGSILGLYLCNLIETRSLSKVNKSSQSRIVTSQREEAARAAKRGTRENTPGPVRAVPTQRKASDKQIRFIRSLKRQALLTNAEFEALLQEKVGGVPVPEELGVRDASKLIDELLELKKRVQDS
jgi:hypothetical protein